MGIVNPRPQMRSLERRTTEARLKAYDEAIKAGNTSEEAFKIASKITKKTMAKK